MSLTLAPPLRIRKEHRDQLQQAAEILGESAQSLVDEALEEYIECAVASYVEVKLEKSGSA